MSREWRPVSERVPSWAWSSVDSPNPQYPTCDQCDAFARWAIGRFETPDSISMFAPTTRWFACGRHLSRILIDADWWLDAVMIYDLTYEPERG